MSTWKPEPIDLNENELLSLPDHLRKTYLASVSLGECSAAEVSIRTGRSRAIESSYLNQLARTGWLSRRRNSKGVSFLPMSRKVPKQREQQGEIRLSQPEDLKCSLRKESRRDKKARRITSIGYLATDYDGTISPIQVARSESHVPLETRVLLNQIGKSLPVSIITMKDLRFVTARTPFAHAWSAIGGLETQIGKRLLRKEFMDSKLPLISKALEYAKTQAGPVGVEIEEKQDSEGHTIAFCVDWRRATNQNIAKLAADKIVEYCDTLDLRTLKYENQPFYDVYPINPDKGKALEEMVSEEAPRKTVMYLGDAETDNTVFRNAMVGVSIGVINDETRVRDLECDYLLKFKDVPDFLRVLIENDFQFSSDFPMIKRNLYRTNESPGGSRRRRTSRSFDQN